MTNRTNRPWLSCIRTPPTPRDTVFTLTSQPRNYFELEPGESFSGGLHRHNDQEEVFYVESGTVIFEVGLEREKVEVNEGELVRFPPGEFQMGANDGEERVAGWALGAPGAMHDWDELQSRTYCPDCEEETTHDVALAEGRFRLTCTECGTVQGSSPHG